METATTPEQQQKILELDGALAAAQISLPYYIPEEHTSEQRQALLRRFLWARQWSVEKALEMIQETASFRAERNLDHRPLFPPPPSIIRGYDVDELTRISAQRRPPRSKDEIDTFLAAMQTSYSGTYHKWDKEHRPIWIERTGRIDPYCLVDTLKRCVKPGEDYKTPAIEVHLYTNEIWGELVEYQRLRLGKPNICQSVVIMDCEGLGMSQLHRPALAILQALSTMDQKYYPEGMHRLYLVNCPRTVTVALSLVKKWLDVRVQQKIVCLKPSETAKLLEEIDAENLPEYLGGKCRCEGGCVPMPTRQLSEEHTDAAATEKIVVPAGQVYAKYIAMTKGTSTTWEFSSENQRSIGYKVEFGTTPVVEQTKLDRPEEPITGCYSADEDGVLTITFDNTFSWMSGKIVLLRTETI